MAFHFIDSDTFDGHRDAVKKTTARAGGVANFAPTWPERSAKQEMIFWPLQPSGNEIMN